MSTHSEDRVPTYERTFLLSEEKRHRVMQLWEVQKYGTDSFSDPDYVCIYGMRPQEWHGCGIRLLARTTVECVRDSLGELIGRDVERLLQNAASPMKVIVIDPFAGSCNSLFWILRCVKNSKGIGFEIDRTIFDMTKRNLSGLDTDIELINGDYRTFLKNYVFPADHLVVVFVAPPWGDALNEVTGLDLKRTTPPIADVVRYVDRFYQEHRILWVTQVHQTVEAGSLADLKSRFDWSMLRIYDINVEGMKHGVLFGTNRWQPQGRTQRS